MSRREEESRKTGAQREEKERRQERERPRYQNRMALIRRQRETKQGKEQRTKTTQNGDSFSIYDLTGEERPAAVSNKMEILRKTARIGKEPQSTPRAQRGEQKK